MSPFIYCFHSLLCESSDADEVQIEGCFPSGFKATPSLTGTVRVEFILQSSSVEEASIPPCLQEVCIIACITVCEKSPSVPLFETGQWVDDCELTDIKDTFHAVEVLTT